MISKLKVIIIILLTIFLVFCCRKDVNQDKILFLKAYDYLLNKNQDKVYLSSLSEILQYDDSMFVFIDGK